MPDEPNSNIEQQLKSWAQKRREEAGPPLELHPATRKLLLDEAMRTHKEGNAQKEPGSKLSWLMVLWPKLVWALPVLVLTAIAAALLLPGVSTNTSKTDQPFELARQNKEKQFGEVLQEDSLARDKDRSAQIPALREPTEETPTASSGIPATPPPAAAPLALKETAPAGGRAKEADLAKSVKAVEADKDVQSRYADAVKQQPAPASQPAPAAGGLTAEQERSVVMRQRYGLGPAEKAEARGGARSPTRELSAAKKPAELNSPQTESPGKSRTELPLALNQPARSSGVGGAAAASEAKQGLDGAPDTRGGVTAESVRLALKAAEGQGAAFDKAAVGVPLQDERRGATDQLAYFGASPAGQAARQFAQVRNYRVNLNSPPALNVLNSFQLEQNGRVVRIVDSDGSTYEGRTDDPQIDLGRKADGNVAAVAVEELKRADDNERVQTRSEVASRDALGIAGQYFGFRVAGTNRTLNQLVVFQGNFLGETNALNASVNSVAAGQAPAQQPAAQAGQSLSFQNAAQIQGARIQGQATIGGSNRMEINAVPVSP